MEGFPIWLGFKIYIFLLIQPCSSLNELPKAQNVKTGGFCHTRAGNTDTDKFRSSEKFNNLYKDANMNFMFYLWTLPNIIELNLLIFNQFLVGWSDCDIATTGCKVFRQPRQLSYFSTKYRINFIVWREREALQMKLNNNNNNNVYLAKNQIMYLKSYIILKDSIHVRKYKFLITLKQKSYQPKILTFS